MNPLNYAGLTSLAWILLVSIGCSTTSQDPWWTYRKDEIHSSGYYGDGFVALPLQLVWERSYPGDGDSYSLVGPATFGESHVYVPVHKDDQSRLAALALTDGAEVWEYKPEGPSIVRAYIHSPPVVIDGVIYASFEIARSDGRSSVSVYALNRDGSPIWESTSPAEGATIVGAMTAANGLLIYCLKHPDGLFLHGLLVESGEEAWRVHIDLDTASLTLGYKEVSPIVSPSHDKIFVSTWADTRALSMEDQQEIWRFKYPEEGRNGSPVLHPWSSHHMPQLRVPVVTDVSIARLYALNPHNGTRLWQAWFDETRCWNAEEVVASAGQRSAVLAAGRPVFLFAGGSVFAYGAEFGSPGWSLQDNDLYVQGPPARWRNVLLYTSHVGVYALSPGEGTLLWSDVPFTDGVAHYNKLLGGVSIDHGLVVASIRNAVRAYASAN